MQLLIAIIIGVVSLFYLGYRFTKQLHQVDKDPKCDDCPVLDIDKDKN